jgi:hypothetical protein
LNLLDEIPKLREAIERESNIRDDAFLPVNESIAGFEVVPVTLAHYTILRRVNSPLLSSNQKTSPEQLAAFLWLLNPKFDPKGGRAKKRFVRRKCRHFFPPDLPLLPTKRAFRRWKRKARVNFYNFSVSLKAARAFMEETLMDRHDAQLVPDGHVAEYYSDSAALVALFAREYRWSEKAVLKMPLRRLFQYMAEIKHHHGQPLFNRLSDQAWSDYSKELSRQGGNN